MAAYVLFSFQELSEYEPKTYSEAIKGKQVAHWKKAMDEEIKSIYDNELGL